jgi:hypothetical protein
MILSSPLGNGPSVAPSRCTINQRASFFHGGSISFLRDVQQRPSVSDPVRHPVHAMSISSRVGRADLGTKDLDVAFLNKLRRKTFRHNLPVTVAARPGTIATGRGDDKDRSGDEAGVSGRNQETDKSSSGIDLSAVVRNHFNEMLCTGIQVWHLPRTLNFLCGVLPLSMPTSS